MEDLALFACSQELVSVQRAELYSRTSMRRQGAPYWDAQPALTVMRLLSAHASRTYEGAISAG